ncbi:MAG TPA: sugar transferase [Akkermansia sp.]|nr:sugar transferase [Akkermansia sp.]
MKKKVKIILFSVLAVAAVFVFKEAKRKQKEARGRGKHVPYGPYEAVIKRPLDIMIVAMAFVPLLPVMGIIALLVRFKLGSPVLFKQERPGLDEKIFTLYKFRTMTDEIDENGEFLPDEKRLTKFGKMLRSTSLDELPELFNILRDDMSLVGPRPLLVEYLPRYSKEQKQRHDVKPGLTGLAQVSGRNGISWEEKFADDVRYAEKITFLGDVRVLLKTVEAVLKKEGISSATSATMEEFTGEEGAAGG